MKYAVITLPLEIGHKTINVVLLWATDRQFLGVENSRSCCPPLTPPYIMKLRWSKKQCVARSLGSSQISPFVANEKENNFIVCFGQSLPVLEAIRTPLQFFGKHYRTIA